MIRFFFILISLNLYVAYQVYVPYTTYYEGVKLITFGEKTFATITQVNRPLRSPNDRNYKVSVFFKFKDNKGNKYSSSSHTGDSPLYKTGQELSIAYYSDKPNQSVKITSSLPRWDDVKISIILASLFFIFEIVVLLLGLFAMFKDLIANRKYKQKMGTDNDNYDEEYLNTKEKYQNLIKKK